MFQKSRDVDRSGYSLADIRSKGEELAGSLGAEYDCHHTNEKLDDCVFKRAEKSTSVPEQKCLQSDMSSQNQIDTLMKRGPP